MKSYFLDHSVCKDLFLLVVKSQMVKWSSAPRLKFSWHLRSFGLESQLMFLQLASRKTKKVELVCMQTEQFTHPTVMSKMLLPTELDTAMSPRPFRATMTLVIRSGIEVPAAKMVRPMISSLMPIVSPTCMSQQGQM